MKVATAKEMKEIDQQTIDSIGIPAIVLMENAAASVAEEIKKDLGNVTGRNIVVFAGVGNNGGDAIAVARHLFNEGANALIILVGKIESVKGEALTNLNIAKNMGINLVAVQDEEYNKEIETALFMADVVIDGLLGTGINKTVNGLLARIIDIINEANRYVISIDIPSGVNGNDGQICGVCIKADKTVTLGIPKAGLFLGEGAKYAGRIETVDIGIPQKVIDERSLKVELVVKENVRKIMPYRPRYAHKGNNGKVLVIAGSKGLTGAAALTSISAMKSGAGIVTLGIPETLNDIMEVKLTEEMTMPLADCGDGRLSSRCLDRLKDEIEKFDVIALGPGLGKGKEIAEVTKWLLNNSPIPLVIDSDGINSLAGNIDLLEKAKSPIILTPHLGEMSRLTGKTVEEIQRNKVELLREYCVKYKCTIILKDWITLIGTQEEHIFINSTGNQGMAVAGSGDVLTGMVASFVGQGLLPVNAAIAGAYIHGLSGDLLAADKGIIGIMAGDIAGNIPNAIKSLQLPELS